MIDAVTVYVSKLEHYGLKGASGLAKGRTGGGEKVPAGQRNSHRDDNGQRDGGGAPAGGAGSGPSPCAGESVSSRGRRSGETVSVGSDASVGSDNFPPAGDFSPFDQLASSLSRLGARHGVAAKITGRRLRLRSLPRPLVMLECRFFPRENGRFSGSPGRFEAMAGLPGDFAEPASRASAEKSAVSAHGQTATGGDPDLRLTCRRLLAQSLAEIVVARMEPDLARRIMTAYYGDFSPPDRDAILEKIQAHLQLAPQRHKVIAGAVTEFLSESNEIHLDGFLTFRVPDYRNMLEEAVDEAVDDFLLDEEYREFIHLLKYFVETQDPKMGLVHVLADGNTGSYRLVDEQGDSIDSGALEEMIIGLGETDIDQGDLLVSALISLAPRQILLHRSVPHVSAETVDTLRRVFDGRVHTCRGCSACRRGGHHGS